VAWTAPVLATAVAAPAFSASPGPADVVSFIWLGADWIPGPPDYWSVVFAVQNGGPTDITLTQVELRTTYHPPAVNTSGVTLVDTSSLQGTQVVRGASTSVRVSLVPKVNPPKDAGNRSLLPGYYNDFPAGVGAAACNSVDTYPSDPGYPESCQRLAADGTFLTFSYTVGGQARTREVLFSDAVACQVLGSCLG
jgi:hypothetical protein